MFNPFSPYKIFEADDNVIQNVTSDDVTTNSSSRITKFKEVSTSVLQHKSLPIPVTARSNAWVCCRSPLGITGSNPARGIDVSLL